VASELGRSSCIEVVAVTEDGPAARAGIRAEDMIVALDGIPLERVDDLQRLMTAERIGLTTRVDVVRDGRMIVVEVVPAELSV